MSCTAVRIVENDKKTTPNKIIFHKKGIVLCGGAGSLVTVADLTNLSGRLRATEYIQISGATLLAEHALRQLRCLEDLYVAVSLLGIVYVDSPHGIWFMYRLVLTGK